MRHSTATATTTPLKSEIKNSAVKGLSLSTKLGVSATTMSYYRTGKTANKNFFLLAVKDVNLQALDPQFNVLTQYPGYEKPEIKSAVNALRNFTQFDLDWSLSTLKSFELAHALRALNIKRDQLTEQLELSRATVSKIVNPYGQELVPIKYARAIRHLVGMQIPGLDLNDPESLTDIAVTEDLL